MALYFSNSKRWFSNKIQNMIKNKPNPEHIKLIKAAVEILNEKWPSNVENNFVALFPRFGNEGKWIIGCKSIPLSYSNKVIGTTKIISKQIKVPMIFACYYKLGIHS